MNFRFLTSICLIVFFLAGCNHSSSTSDYEKSTTSTTKVDGRSHSSYNSDWAETIVTIIEIKGLEDGLYSYTFEFKIPESTAINIEGKKITGPIKQSTLGKKKPIANQKLRAKYMKEEPIIFKLLDPVQYEK